MSRLHFEVTGQALHGDRRDPFHVGLSARDCKDAIAKVEGAMRSGVATIQIHSVRETYNTYISPRPKTNVYDYDGSVF